MTFMNGISVVMDISDPVLQLVVLNTTTKPALVRKLENESYRFFFNYETLKHLSF